MKTKLLFYTIQKFKDVLKLNGIFTFLIIFLTTVSSFGQSDGITFDCSGGIISFGVPVENELFNGYPYWVGGTDNFGSGTEYLLFVQEVNGDDRWEVHEAGEATGNFPNDTNFGVLYFYSPDYNVTSPTCDNVEGNIGGSWIVEYNLLPCYPGTVFSTCAGGPIEVCPTFYADTDGDGFGDPDNSIDSCTGAPVGYVEDNTDCFDDGIDAETAYPGAEEIPFDMIDNDCDGEVDEDDNPPVVLEYCGDAQKKILICHNGKTKCVSINAMDAHLAHGDYLGPCGGSSKEGDIDISEEGPTSFDVVSWPNPSTNLFNIKMVTPNSIDKIDFKVFDINGRLIHSNIIYGNEDYQFGGQLSSGVYFVSLSQANNIKVIKVIKQ